MTIYIPHPTPEQIRTDFLKHDTFVSIFGDGTSDKSEMWEYITKHPDRITVDWQVEFLEQQQPCFSWVFYHAHAARLWASVVFLKQLANPAKSLMEVHYEEVPIPHDHVLWKLSRLIENLEEGPIATLSWGRRYRFWRYCMTHGNPPDCGVPEWLKRSWFGGSVLWPSDFHAIRTLDLDRFPALLYALEIAISDGYLVLRKAAKGARRFFNIAIRLPMDLQQVLANRVYGAAHGTIAWSETSWRVAISD